MKKDFAALESVLGVTFKDKDLLTQAFVHRSYLNENKDFHLDHNERLEFLGDAVLELVVTDYLYANYPNPEGELTNWRSALVNSKKLSEIAKRLGFEAYLYLSHGEKKDTGRAREYILGNTMEAVIGSIYLDQGYEAARVFILKNVLSELKEILELGSHIDPKSRLQEVAQAEMRVTPEYRVMSEEGPDHAKKLTVAVFIGGKKFGSGTGFSKQAAQTEAAQMALEKGKWNSPKPTEA